MTSSWLTGSWFTDGDDAFIPRSYQPSENSYSTAIVTKDCTTNTSQAIEHGMQKISPKSLQIPKYTWMPPLHATDKPCAIPASSHMAKITSEKSFTKTDHEQELTKQGRRSTLLSWFGVRGQSRLRAAIPRAGRSSLASLHSGTLALHRVHARGGAK